MSLPDPITIVNDAWLALVLFWMVSAFKVKRMKYVAPISIRIAQLIFLVPGITLLFAPRFRIGPLHVQMLPRVFGLGILGSVVTVLGVVFAMWARYCIGTNWSSAIAIRENHELIQSGPYRWIRHPIYTGIITAAWGTALVVGQLGAFIGVILITMGFAFKSRQEEVNLYATFGELWTQHRRRTGMFLPRMR